MASVKRFNDLKVWQLGVKLSVEVYSATKNYPKEEVFGLANQSRRAAVSIPSNIAEGQGRGTTKDFIHFLKIARGSLGELETQLFIAHELHYIESSVFSNLCQLLSEEGRMLQGLINALERPKS
ncbi:MAG: four helix bundle protein [Bacteroidota bacterium]|nr:four helix bundle protein [Bacteroidota bacterium]MDP4231402.1 four helix bundle protein [Bacteroidota bacterium]MDP4236808.1 four helix bundle protein [Bacteroidota bacterium]